MDAVWPYLAAILPTILVAILFYFLIKSMLEGDRRERLAQRQFEAEQDRAQAVRPPMLRNPKGMSRRPVHRGLRRNPEVNARSRRHSLTSLYPSGIRC